MGEAVVRTVVDPETGEDVELMAFNNRGTVTLQRLHGRHDTPRYNETLANFGDVASQAYGMRKTGELPPAAELVQRETPQIPLRFARSSKRERERELRQRRYRELLGDVAPDMENELLIRRALSVPLLRALPSASRAITAATEQDLRQRLAIARSPYLRARR